MFIDSYRMIRMLLGDLKGNGKQLSWIEKFGIKEGYSFFIWTDHLDYLSRLNIFLNGKIEIIKTELANRWKLVNKLIFAHFAPPGKVPEFIKDEGLNLAALVAYPLLEEMARIISKAWDEEGFVLIDITSKFGLPKQRIYKKRGKIVSLEHKLLVMKYLLDKRLQEMVNSLDKRMRKSVIKGNTQERAPLFERLTVNRNQWLHGRRFRGWEAIFISLFLSMIYFPVTDTKILNQDVLQQLIEISSQVISIKDIWGRANPSSIGKQEK